MAQHDEDQPQSAELGAFIQEDSAETLEGDPNTDALDAGYSPADRPSSAMSVGTTANEVADGETLEQKLAEEEPDVGDDPDALSDDEDTDDRAADPRAGRLSQDYDLADPQRSDLTATDEGIDGGAASAEEAAVHEIVDQDFTV